MIPPRLSDEQRRRAQAQALQARQQRARIRADLKARVMRLREVIDLSDHDEAIGRMRVIDVLEALPAIGPTKAERIMTRLAIAPSRRLRGLGAHQRRRLLEEFA